MKRLLFITVLCVFSVVGVRAQHGIPIDDLYYALFDDTHEAMLNEGGEWSGFKVLTLPSEVPNDGFIRYIDYKDRTKMDGTFHTISWFYRLFHF